MIIIEDGVTKLDDEQFQEWKGFKFIPVRKLPEAQYKELLHFFLLAQGGKTFEPDYFFFNQVRETKFVEFMYEDGEVSPVFELSVAKGFYDLFYEKWKEAKFAFPELIDMDDNDRSDIGSVEDFAKAVLTPPESILEKYQDGTLTKVCEIIYNDDPDFIERMQATGPWCCYDGDALVHTA